MKATKELLESLKQAVHATELSWDAMRDFEAETGKTFKLLDSFVHDIAVIGAESITMEQLQEFLDDAETYEDDEEEEDEGDNDND